MQPIIPEAFIELTDRQDDENNTQQTTIGACLHSLEFQAASAGAAFLGWLLSVGIVYISSLENRDINPAHNKNLAISLSVLAIGLVLCGISSASSKTACTHFANAAKALPLVLILSGALGLVIAHADYTLNAQRKSLGYLISGIFAAIGLLSWPVTLIITNELNRRQVSRCIKLTESTVNFFLCKQQETSEPNITQNLLEPGV